MRFAGLRPADTFDQDSYPSVHRVAVPFVQDTGQALERLSLPDWDRVVPLELNAVQVAESVSPVFLRSLMEAPHINLILQEPSKRPDFEEALNRFNQVREVDIRVRGTIDEVRDTLDFRLSRFGRWTGRGRLPSNEREVFIHQLTLSGEKLLAVEEREHLFVWLKSVSPGDSKDSHVDVLESLYAQRYERDWWLRATCTHAGPGMEWMADANVIRPRMPRSDVCLKPGGEGRTPESEYLHDPAQINQIGTHTVTYLKNGIEGRGLFLPLVHRAKITDGRMRRLRSMQCSALE